MKKYVIDSDILIYFLKGKKEIVAKLSVGCSFQKMMSGQAQPVEIKEFGELWQDRVKRIFENTSSVIEVVEV